VRFDAENQHNVTGNEKEKGKGSEKGQRKNCGGGGGGKKKKGGPGDGYWLVGIGYLTM